MIKNLYTKITGDPNEKEIQRLLPAVEKIGALEPELQKLSDDQLRAKTGEFKKRITDALAGSRQRVAEMRAELDNAADADDRRMIEEHLKQAQKDLVATERTALDEILPEAFACVREASVRTIGLRHFDVQMIGGIVLHEGKAAEMKTGEGKTLVATLPLYLNALLGRGAHLVTVNDYLARRDAQWMGPIYHALGLSVGVLQQGEKNALMFDPEFKAATQEMNFLRAGLRREAYAADITYGTNNEFGFDYLRDNMAWRLEDRVQRELYYAIVDEVDNILIDEARTPLIISGPAGEASDEYYRLADLVRKLGPDDYTVDQRTRSITLTEAGYDRVEELLGMPLYSVDRPEELDPQQAKIMHHLEAALKAEYLFKRDKDYIVRKGQVIIVDEFTGRLMSGRRWSDGLHQAVEAKERVPIQQESVTYATVTLQNYFRLYQRLAGMTGTAKTEEDEFQKVYGLDVVVVPTHKPMIRIDHPDLVYRNEEAKWRAVTLEIVGLHARGQPTLVGTTSIENSERLSKRLAAPKLQMLARVRLLMNALDTHATQSDKQRTTLKLILGRGIDDAPENYDEALSSRLFHDYDLGAVGEAMRKLKMQAGQLARIKARAAGRRGKELANVAKQFNVREGDLRELEKVGERDLKFAVRLEERQLRLDGAQALCEEIAAHPDDLAKIAPRFNLSLDVATQVYQELRLTRAEMGEINRALIESLGDVESVRDEYRVRAAEMDVIVKHLFLREDDIARLAKKMQINADPFAAENADALREIFAVGDIEPLTGILRGGVPHAVLNAKEHEKEAGIIARAGQVHAITLATNMAGRGVDIKLGGELTEETLNEVGRVLHRAGIDPYDMTFDQIAQALEKIPKESYLLDAEHVEQFQKYMRDRVQVRELGGLRIIGTERHEARRIDNQLRGRSGRQGDRGSSRFYVSLEDEIMRRMGGKGLVDRVWIEDIPIEHDWVTKAIEQAQVKMESYNFDIRKHLLEYDDVLNKQREVIYGQRYRILTKADLRDDLRGWLEEEIARILAEDLKMPDHQGGASRLLLHLDALLPGFYLSENEFWPPFSISLIQRTLDHADDVDTLSGKILDAARRAMELHRDFLIQSVVPEAVNQFEQQYKTTWDEIEDLAKNTLATAQQEAEEQNQRVDPRALVQTVSQAVGMQIGLRAERGVEIGEREILDAVHRAYDARVVDQVVRRVAKRSGMSFEFRWNVDENLSFDALTNALAASIDEAYTKQAEKHLADIERELGERVKLVLSSSTESTLSAGEGLTVNHAASTFAPLSTDSANLSAEGTSDDVRGARLSNLLFGISHTRQAAFDSRTHQRIEFLVPRFPWVHLAAAEIKDLDQQSLRDEILAYWNHSLEQLETLRGGAQAFNNLLRELMLSVVTNLWVEYLTEIEALREGIGLQAFGQRDPLVEYKRRAYEMFQDLYARIRSQVVSYIFTYQYRGFAKLESEDRNVPRVEKTPVAAPTRQMPQAQTAPRVTAPQAAVAPTKNAKQPAPARMPVGPSSTRPLGRNDPCWCGSGKKYKHCHMQSDLR